MEKISKEKNDCMKQITRLQEKFDETEDECKQLRVTISELEKISIKMRETYDQTIHVSLKIQCYNILDSYKIHYMNYNATAKNVYCRICAKGIVNLRRRTRNCSRCRFLINILPEKK